MKSLNKTKLVREEGSASSQSDSISKGTRYHGVTPVADVGGLTGVSLTDMYSRVSGQLGDGYLSWRHLYQWLFVSM